VLPPASARIGWLSFNRYWVVTPETFIVKRYRCKCQITKVRHGSGEINSTFTNCFHRRHSPFTFEARIKCHFCPKSWGNRFKGMIYCVCPANIGDFVCLASAIRRINCKGVFRCLKMFVNRAQISKIMAQTTKLPNPLAQAYWLIESIQNRRPLSHKCPSHHPDLMKTRRIYHLETKRCHQNRLKN